MKLIKPYYKIESQVNGLEMLKAIEKAGRTCYKSEDKITDDSCIKFVKMLINKKHFSVLEHQSITVRFVIDRGVSHELVRHRIAGHSQESTRYCNYGNSEHITFIIPCWLDLEEQTIDSFDSINQDEDTLEWLFAMSNAEMKYKTLLGYDWTPQQARSVLPNSLKTEIVTTANLREWRTIFEQRTSSAAHPQMREVMIPLLKELQNKLPIIFDDIKI